MRPPLRRLIVAIGGIGTVAACGPGADPLLRPRPAVVNAPAPDSFLVVFATSRGDFTVKARRAWSPAGVDRFHYLASRGFYDGARFYRVVPNFVAQFGIPGDPAVTAVWRDRFIADDTVRASNRRGMVSFARSGRETRTTQLFVNLRDNTRLDTLNGFGFPPIGEVIAGMAVVDSLHAGYGDAAPAGRGPAQDSIRLQGTPYLQRHFPQLDSIRSTRVLTRWWVRR